MNPAVIQIFCGLASDAEPIQIHAVVELSTLLGRAMQRPESTDEYCRQFLSDELLSLRLSPTEVREILDDAIKALDSNVLKRNAKMSLFLTIMNLAELRYGDALFHFFSVYADTFDEQLTFSSLAQLKRFVKRAKSDNVQVKALMAKHAIMRIIDRLRLHQSQRVRRSAEAFLDYLKS
jgi:hypothetical protein